MQTETPGPTSYELLQVHPAAPLDLITAAYWRLAGQVQGQRANDPSSEALLHQLTRAYQVLADPGQRSQYDAALGIGEQPLAPRLPRRRQGLLGRSRQREQADFHVDYYDILRVAPEADPAIVAEAYSTLRNYYLRLVNTGRAGPELVDYLEEAYSVTSDPDRRRAYDDERSKWAGAESAVLESAGHNGSNGNGHAGPAVAPTSPAVHQPPAPRVAAAEAPARPASAPGVKSVQTQPPGARTGDEEAGAGGVLGALGRQFASLSRRERRQLEEKLSQRVQEQHDSDGIEAALLQRLSFSAAQQESDASSQPPVARFTLIEGPGSGATFQMETFPLTIGGDSDCDITLPGLASRQARLLYRDGCFVVYIMVSPAGEPDAAPWWVLGNGDDLNLGPYKLRFTAARD